jgi:hypothetical protein
MDAVLKKDHPESDWLGGLGFIYGGGLILGSFAFSYLENLEEKWEEKMGAMGFRGRNAN